MKKGDAGEGGGETSSHEAEEEARFASETEMRLEISYPMGLDKKRVKRNFEKWKEKRHISGYEQKKSPQRQRRGGGGGGKTTKFRGPTSVGKVLKNNKR